MQKQNKESSACQRFFFKARHELFTLFYELNKVKSTSNAFASVLLTWSLFSILAVLITDHHNIEAYTEPDYTTIHIIRYSNLFHLLEATGVSHQVTMIVLMSMYVVLAVCYVYINFKRKQ